MKIIKNSLLPFMTFAYKSQWLRTIKTHDGQWVATYDYGGLYDHFIKTQVGFCVVCKI